MKRIIDTSEVLGTVESPAGHLEVCAMADAQFDEARQHLVVRLDSCLRTTDLRSREERIHADWLPKPEVVDEGVELGEADEVARDVFHRWVRRVRQAVPGLHESAF